MFDFRRATVFCLGYCLYQHKMTTYSKIMGDHAPWAGMGQFGDKSVIRHDTFNGSAFYVLLQKILGLALGLLFKV